MTEIAAKEDLFRRANFLKFVQLAGRHSGDGLVFKMTFDIHGQAIRGRVTPVPILLQRLHNDPIKVATDESQKLGAAPNDAVWRLWSSLQRPAC